MDDFPSYSFADELKGPSELGIQRDGSFKQVANAIAGINYYADAIGFGEPTAYSNIRGGAFSDQKPLGIRFFVKTGKKCTNGQDMYEYIDTIPKGDLMGKRVPNELRKMGLPQLRGLAPGIMEDAVGALNPIPLVRAATNGGGPQPCKLLRARVGSEEWPYVRSRKDPSQVWIKGDVQFDGEQRPTQERWILDPWFVEPDPDDDEEGFANQRLQTSQTFSLALLSLLLVGGIVLYKYQKK
jgi:hypothetical protein